MVSMADDLPTALRSRGMRVTPQRVVLHRALRELDRHVTAQLAQLTLSTGELSWINAGHPPPMIVRRGHRVDLHSDPCPPIGLGSLAPGDLALAGVRTTIVERHPSRPPYCRGFNLNSRSLDLLARRGLAEGLVVTCRRAVTDPADLSDLGQALTACGPLSGPGPAQSSTRSTRSATDSKTCVGR